MRQAKNGPECFPPPTDVSIMEKREIMYECLVRTANGKITLLFSHPIRGSMNFQKQDHHVTFSLKRNDAESHSLS